MAAIAIAMAAATAIPGCSDPSSGGASAPDVSRPAPSTTAGTTDAPTATTQGTAAPSPPTTPATTTTAGSTPRAPVDELEVRATPDGGAPEYRRDEFGDGWNYDPASGCNTRELVLIEESLIPATTDDRCHPSAGRWRSSYDGVVTTDPDDLQIDHVVALADAWRSGAWRWDDDRRRAFANDRDHPETLAAVSGHANQSKGDSTPDRWLPEDRSQWCAYATTWVAIKSEWQLSVTAAEKSALVQVLDGC